jgi:hypothetical protein
MMITTNISQAKTTYISKRDTSWLINQSIITPDSFCSFIYGSTDTNATEIFQKSQIISL